LPPSRKVKMSDCHIWLGVARSKNRGLGGFFGGFFFDFGSSRFCCNVRRTVSWLPGRNNIRRNTWAIRFTPKCGCCCFSVTICALTAVATLGALTFLPPMSGCSPASPCWRYRWTHAASVLLPIPNSRAISSVGNPSSKRSLTALRRSSNEWFPTRRASPLGGWGSLSLFSNL